MLKELREIVQQVTASSDLNQAMGELVRQTRSAMRVDCCSIYLRQEHEQNYLLAATDGLAAKAVGRARIPLGEGIVGLIGEKEELINLADAQLHPKFKYLPEAREDAFKSFLGAPIIHQRKTLGVLVVQQKQVRLFEEGEESFLVTLASQLATVIAHAEAKGNLRSPNWHGILRGLAGSPGVAIGRAWVWRPRVELSKVKERKADNAAVQHERLDKVLVQVEDELNGMALRFKESQASESVAVFEVYQYILKDPVFIGLIREQIERGWIAGSAVKRVCEKQIAQFSVMSDPYLRERAADIRDLGQRLLTRLIHEDEGLLTLAEPIILVADEISATLIAEIPRSKLKGIVSAKGSINSHAAILARAMGIPAVMGIDHSFELLEDRTLIVDGYNGDLLVEPVPSVLREYRRLIVQEEQMDELFATVRNESSVTLDGVTVSLLLNAGLSADTDIAMNDTADGVGLFRTEIPFMMRDRFPSEQEQVTSYRRVMASYVGKPVCMRTLDVGGDKQLPYFPIVEENPFLGWRGIRLTLDHPEIFLVQLKAMLRASQGLDNLSIMLPMVTSLDEVRVARRMLDRAWREVSAETADQQGIIRYPSLGVMIEVPSLLYLLPDLAPLVDFWSVGTNDLTQYLLAVDRNNGRVAGIYDTLHPAVLRALQQIIDAARRYAKPVSICGELAGDPIGVLVLLAMGYRRFSMNNSNLMRIKYIVRQSRCDELQKLLQEALSYQNTSMFKGLFGRYLEERGLGGLLRGGR
ncbi:phosphoenolpyruvate--protein phosphotransferase [Oceanisphaera arctica]|uniref:phosphoenolpyruvate--protein phosphotransferase n=1 Tax=Oceanisphaera arctica TaxID=641510 RepID=A0A2P5TP30_9GAMM|nr:phosphoenolpyruvate--protein phosphotransferase [Oceanisphaera arctica]PPL17384.1 phosphoenolpyruvate--protein phosphotransferase [Oceanisphaera arctica]GHA08463.1 phosphoenolpyruvate--protein phosphotransferase [Oceanisphaera arctica]